MALPQYSTEQLIENIKRRCAVPTSQTTYTEADFCALANDELQGELVPLLMSTREEYFVEYVDVVPDGDELYIPDDAVGAKLRSVCIKVPGSPVTFINIPRIDLDLVAGIGYSSNLTLVGFYVQGNKLILYPSNSIQQNQEIRLFYYKRTLTLAAPSDYGIVTAVDLETNTVSLSFVPYEWDVGTTLNAVSSVQPFKITSAISTIVADSSPTLILDDATGISVGDYVSLQGFSAIPQVPIEAHAYLAQLTAVKCLEGLGDRSGMEAAQAKAEMLKKNMLIMISQRVDGSTKKIIHPNGGLRAGAGLWGRGFSGSGNGVW